MVFTIESLVAVIFLKDQIVALTSVRRTRDIVRYLREESSLLSQ